MTVWTPQAWDLYEAVLASRGYAIEHCVHCDRTPFAKRDVEWGVPGHPHPTCLIVTLPNAAKFPSTDPAHYIGC